ncbi:unnamed protein product [Closterium sp. NIES-53]
MGHHLGFDSWLEGLQLYLHSVTRDDVSLFKHTSRSLQAPKAPAEPAADAGKEVRTHGAGGSGRGGHQELEPSCVAACAPTSTFYAHPSTVLSCLVVPPASSGSTEGPIAADFEGPGVVGGGDGGSAGSGGARSPLVGGVGCTGAGGAGAGGVGSGGALQLLPRQPILLEQLSSSLPEPTPTCTTPPLLFPLPDSPLPVHVSQWEKAVRNNRGAIVAINLPAR